MSYQEYFNIMLGLIAFLGGWWMKAIWQSIKELTATDNQLLMKVNAIEILIAGQYAKREEVEKINNSIVNKLEKLENVEALLAQHYVTKEDHNRNIEALFKKLDRMETKIDSKG